MEDKKGCGGCRSKEDCTEPVKGCGKCCRGGCSGSEILLTEKEMEFMLLLSQLPFLPLARIRIKCPGREDRLIEVAPVYMSSENETLESIRKTGQVLSSLENRGLITLDYDKPLINGDYSIYKNPTLLKVLCQTAAADSSSPCAPELDMGSIALTPLGMDVLDSLDIL